MSRDKNFIGKNGKVFLVICPKEDCGLENYAPNVATGICTWCGYDANTEKEKEDKE